MTKEVLTCRKVVEQLSDVVVEESLPKLPGPNNAVLEAGRPFVNLEKKK